MVERGSLKMRPLLGICKLCSQFGRVSSSTGAAKAQSIGETRVVYKTATSSSSSPISVIKVTYAKLDQTLSTSSRKVVRLFDNEDKQFVPSKASAIKFECKSLPDLPLRTEVSDYGVICIVPSVPEEQNVWWLYYY